MFEQDVAYAVSKAAIPQHLSASEVSQIELLQELSEPCHWQPLWPNVKETLRKELTRGDSKKVALLPAEDSWPDVVIVAGRAKRTKKAARSRATPQVKRKEQPETQQEARINSSQQKQQKLQRSRKELRN